MKLTCSDPETVSIIPGQKSLWLYTVTIEFDGATQTRLLCHLEQLTECEALQRLRMGRPSMGSGDLLTAVCASTGFAEIPGTGVPDEATRPPITGVDDLLMAILAAEDEAVAKRVRQASERLAEQ